MFKKSLNVTAHAGCNGTKMDTIESVEAGISYGADVIEIDLNIDEEENLILCHDVPKKGEEYVKFKSVLEVISEKKDILLNVDVKNIKALDKLNLMISEFKLEARAFYTGINYENLVESKEKLKGKKYFLNLDPSKLNILRLQDEAYLRSLLEDEELHEILGININFKLASAELIKVCKEKGLLCSVWTVDSIEDMKKMIALEVDNITTRQVDSLKKLL